MGRKTNGDSGGRQENKRWSLIYGPRLLTVLVVISMIHVATSHNKMSTLDQGLNKIRSPRYAKTTGNTNTQSSRVCNSPECVVAAQQIKSLMKMTVDPCDDFYEYACGNWLIVNPLPNGYVYYDTIKKLKRARKTYFRNILENGRITINGANRNVAKEPINFFQSCMNQTAIENVGDLPLKEVIRDLGGWSMVEEDRFWDEDNWDFNGTFGSIHRNYISKKGPLFSIYVEYDKASDGTRKFAIRIEQLEEEDQMKGNAAEKKYIKDVVTLLGGGINVTEKVQELVDFGTKIKESLTGPEEITPKNKMTLKQLQQQVPQLNWTNHLNNMFPVTVAETELIYVNALPYLKKAMKLVQNASKSVLANYMVWNVIKNKIGYLPTPYRQAYLNFIGEAASNVSREGRTKTCALIVEESLNELMGAAYVNDNSMQFRTTKNMAKQLTNEIRKGFTENVNSLTWLNAASKTKIKEKVNAIEDKIGFPDYFLTTAKVAQRFQKYNTLILRKNEYFKNQIAISKWKNQQMLKQFGQPVNDDDLWPVHAHEGDDGAFYVYDNNWLVQPLAILQRPNFYRSEFLRAVNFGSLGAELGLEIMNGFNKYGRQFDKHGRQITGQLLSNRTLQDMHARESCFSRQYSNYRFFGMQVDVDYPPFYNGQNAGLKAANKAYNNWSKKYPSKTWTLPNLNLTNEQLFYVGFGQNRCRGGTRDGLSKTFIERGSWDMKFGVIGPLSNSCEFAKAFNCSNNSRMNPPQKCALWSKDGPLF